VYDALRATRQTKSYEEAARSLSEASAVAKELSAEEMNSLVSAVMRHMLFKPTDAGPTARTELATLINSKYKGKRNLTNVVIALAQVRSASTSVRLRELSVCLSRGKGLAKSMVH
jgi:hypothetical protein